MIFPKVVFIYDGRSRCIEAKEDVQEKTRVVPAARRYLGRLGVKDPLVTLQPQLCHD